MGVIFERAIPRFGEGGTYPPLDPEQGINFSTQMMPVRYVGLKRYNLMEFCQLLHTRINLMLRRAILK